MSGTAGGDRPTGGSGGSGGGTNSQSDEDASLALAMRLQAEEDDAQARARAAEGAFGDEGLPDMARDGSGVTSGTPGVQEGGLVG